jgi:uncharacterized protein (DUF58 family)
MSATLLEPAFVRELEALRRLLRPRARSGRIGSRTAPRRGGASEFEVHRPYAAGDDIGAIDWLAFARTGQPVLKERRSDEDVVVRLVVDASASFGFGEPRPIDMATRVAAAVAYLALSAGERAELVVGGGKSGGFHASAPVRGRAALPGVLRELSGIEPTGAIDLAEAVRRTLLVSDRPGMLVVMSDFLDPGPVVEALRRARFAGHDVTLVQVLGPEVLSPELDGDLTLVDAESGETLDLLVDGATLSAYRARLTRLFDALSGFARSAGACYVRARADEHLATVVRKVMAHGVD